MKVTQRQAIGATLFGVGLALTGLAFQRQAARVAAAVAGTLITVTAWTLHAKNGPGLRTVTKLIEKAGARDEDFDRDPDAVKAVEELFSRKGVSVNQRIDVLKALAGIKEAGRGIETIKQLVTILLASYDDDPVLSDDEDDSVDDTGDIGMFPNAIGKQVEAFLNDQLKAHWAESFTPGVSEVDKWQLGKMMALEFLSIDDLVKMVPKQTAWALKELFKSETFAAEHLREAMKLLGEDLTTWDLWIIEALYETKDQEVRQLINQTLTKVFDPARELRWDRLLFSRLKELGLLTDENLVQLLGNKVAINRNFVEELFGRENVPIQKLTEAMNNLISMVDHRKNGDLAFWAGRGIQVFLKREPNLEDEEVQALIQLPLQLNERDQYVDALALKEETGKSVQDIIGHTRMEELD